MNTFNINRFARTLTCEVLTRKCIYAALGAFLAVMVPAAFRLIMGISNMDMDWFASLLAVVMAAYFITCGAFIVNNLDDSKKRINAFLLPASKLEKFVSRYLFLLIAMPIALLIGFAAGDVLQMLLFKLIQGEASPLMPALAEAMSNTVSTDSGTLAFLWLLHSLYLLFGLFFRRHAWLLSCLLLLAVAILISVFTISGAKAILDLIYGAGNYNIVPIDSWWVTAIEYAVCIALTVFNYWAAFRIYSNLQAINNKWYNL